MKVFFDSIGCRLNQAEIEHMAAVFRLSGHEIIDTPRNADLVVINSCAVTAAAASDSRAKVRQAFKAGAQQIILTGCWATIEPEDAKALPGVAVVFKNNEKDELPERILGTAISLFDLEPLERQPLPGTHHRTRAFIKVQDGCDNYCTFCITRVARGQSRSVHKNEILSEVLRAQKGGAHEIVLSGVNLGAWGHDLGEGENLTNLISYLLDNTQIERVRLSSIEPWDMDEHFLDLWQNRRMCRHFHIPLQSGCENTLKRMGRRTTPDQYRRLISSLRERIPDAAITTDIIVGFVGESVEEHTESLVFVKEMKFAGGHVFRFSPREGTPAWQLGGRVNGKIAHTWSEEMRQVIRASEIEYWHEYQNQTVEVLWESSEKLADGKWRLHGLSENYLPISLLSEEDRHNQFDEVMITGIQDEYVEAVFTSM
jgi:threonylcarbamoyladenosine tRNA methylthiotransferase MtaB